MRPENKVEKYDELAEEEIENKINIINNNINISDCNSIDLITEINNKYNYGSINLSAMLCLAFIMFVEGIQYSLYGVYLIPISDYYKWNKERKLLATSSFFFFCGIGSIFCACLAKVFNRMKLITLSSLISMILHLLTCFLQNYTSFISIRNLIGLLYGIIVPLSFNVVNEYLPIKLRGFCLLMLLFCFFYFKFI